MLFASTVEEVLSPEGGRGCFLINTAVDLQNQSAEIKLLVKASLEDFRLFFERMIEHGKVRGEVSAEIDSAEVAAGMLGLHIGIRVMARGSPPPEIVRHMGAQAMRLVI